jgi:hypothetical protein
MDWLRENVVPVALGGKTKSTALTAAAMTADAYQPAPAPAPAPAPSTDGMGQLGGRHRRRSHRGRRHHRKTKKHSRR